MAISAFPLEGSVWLLLAWLNSRLVRYLIEASAAAAEETRSGGTPSRHYLGGWIGALPSPHRRLNTATADALEAAARAIAEVRASVDAEDETTRRFTGLPLGAGGLDTCWSLAEKRTAAVCADAQDACIAYADIERNLAQTLELTSGVQEELSLAVGPVIGGLPRDSLSGVESEELASMFTLPMSSLVDFVSQRLGMSRWIRLNYFLLDRRLELLCLHFQRHPAVIVEARQRFALLPPEEPLRSTEDLISYLIGCAFGRWDIRIGKDPSLAPPLPDLSIRS